MQVRPQRSVLQTPAGHTIHHSHRTSGGGRNSLTNRYLRHFSVISVTAFDNDTLSTIFSALVDWWMKKAGFGPNVTKLAKPLVAASLEVYETIQKELLPTPTKSHYTFNLRDVSKVIQVRPTSKGLFHSAQTSVMLAGTAAFVVAFVPFSQTSWEFHQVVFA